jgi:general nucleoside transport system ATP-binding protein
MEPQHSGNSPMAIHMRADAAVWLHMHNITKTFPGAVANDRVNLEVRAGEVHALLGENGAGKTTLMRILYGLYQPDAGDMWVRGRPVQLRSPRDAIALGIGMVPQHFLLVRRHTVAENIALGLPGARFFFPVRKLEARLRDVAERYGLPIDPGARIWQLSPGEQQRVEILKALLRGSEILILDEPTTLLTPQETSGLFSVLARMRAEGRTVIFISHKLGEVMTIADRITVLRQGRVVATLPTAEADARQLARLMVGRDIAFEAPPHHPASRGLLLRVAALEADNDRGILALRDVSFAVQRGEILGVTGVAGNGQQELVDVVTGLRQPRAGQIYLGDREITHTSRRERFAMGMAHIPTERQLMGVVPAMSVAENLALRDYHAAPLACGPLLNHRAMARLAAQAMQAHAIATPSPATPVAHLSGGNVQKLILARELSGQPRLIVAAHPTQGLDVGATAQTHRMLLQHRAQGAAILLVSEDLEEIMRVCDRIMVLCAGHIMGIVPATTADKEQLGLMMAGVHQA